MRKRHLDKCLGISVALVAAWGSLAQIAPGIFQVKGTSMEILIGWLSNPKFLWLLMPITIVWLTVYLSRLDNRIDGFERDFQAWLKNQATRIDQQFNSQFQEFSKDTKGTLDTAMKRLNDWYADHGRRISALEQAKSIEIGDAKNKEE